MANPANFGTFGGKSFVPQWSQNEGGGESIKIDDIKMQEHHVN